MRLSRLLKFMQFLSLALVCVSPVLAQSVPTPQLNLSGTIGTIGFPVLNSGTFSIPTDADYTLSGSSVNTSCVSCKITSTVPLTAPRKVIYPAGRYFLNVENATTGGQSITIAGPSGLGVIIPNGQATSIWNDGTNFVQLGGGAPVNSPNFTGSPQVNGSPICTNGTGCPPSTAAPGSETRFISATICNGGVAYSSGLSTYDNNQPQLGCINPSTSSGAFMAFNAAASTAQYATTTFATPPFWTASDLAITFTTPVTVGNVSWILEYGCSNPNNSLGTITWSSPTTVTANASSSANGLVNTPIQLNAVQPGTNGCVAGTTSAGSLVTVRLHRSASDTAAADANLLGLVLTQRRSQ